MNIARHTDGRTRSTAAVWSMIRSLNGILAILAITLSILSPTASAQQSHIVYGPPAPGETTFSNAIGVAAPNLGPLIPGWQNDPSGSDLGADIAASFIRLPDGSINPLRVLDSAGRALPGASANSPDGSAREGGGIAVALNIVMVLTVITLAPSIILMTTCFVRMIVVLGLLKQALGTQQVPPAQVTLGLALFMTMMVMGPTFEKIYNDAVVPYSQGEIRDLDTLWIAAAAPMRDFMFAQIEATGNWSSLYMVMEYRGIDVSEESLRTMRYADVPTTILVPAFMLSELKVAFMMGFRVYLPFLVIDMVIASILISMSMMMLPPVLISLPFKLLLFVLVDGWTLIVGSLMGSFVINPNEIASAAGSTSQLIGPTLDAAGPMLASFMAGLPPGTPSAPSEAMPAILAAVGDNPIFTPMHA